MPLEFSSSHLAFLSSPVACCNKLNKNTGFSLIVCFGPSPQTHWARFLWYFTSSLLLGVFLLWYIDCYSYKSFLVLSLCLFSLIFCRCLSFLCPKRRHFQASIICFIFFFPLTPLWKNTMLKYIPHCLYLTLLCSFLPNAFPGQQLF